MSDVQHFPTRTPRPPAIVALGPYNGVKPRGSLATDACEACLPLQEAHHRIANHFAMLGSYVNVRAGRLARQETEPDRASIVLLLEGIKAQIDTVAEVHRMLATVGHGATIDVGAHLHGILAPFASGVFGDVKLREDLEPGCRVRGEQILQISQIVAEVVTNAIKHTKPGELTVSVSCHRTAGDRLLLEILDNGPGLPEAVVPPARGGIGMRMLSALAVQLRARIDFISTPLGLKFQLSLPV